MVWETGELCKVTVHTNGTTKEFDFEPSMLLENAVRTVARDLNLGTVVVENDGEKIEPSEGKTQLGDLGEICVYPKSAGAF